MKKINYIKVHLLKRYPKLWCGNKYIHPMGWLHFIVDSGKAEIQCHWGVARISWAAQMTGWCQAFYKPPSTFINSPERRVSHQGLSQSPVFVTKSKLFSGHPALSSVWSLVFPGWHFKAHTSWTQQLTLLTSDQYLPWSEGSSLSNFLASQHAPQTGLDCLEQGNPLFSALSSQLRLLCRAFLDEENQSVLWAYWPGSSTFHPSICPSLCASGSILNYDSYCEHALESTM